MVCHYAHPTHHTTGKVRGKRLQEGMKFHSFSWGTLPALCGALGHKARLGRETVSLLSCIFSVLEEGVVSDLITVMAH